ncbi:hypothetical protein OEW28_16490 [Defluviimonas sp. WL0002]|uniref:HNH endonuclease n=1 Tax=Albidovulum marisflavi TaxID=2984159 RepID=A0ABT2ZHL7_9RHOB|nr:hypothetical protein [Defluviimonas sp. WL0002]MCV2870226.1 hypothetical protein [Defluviimonas sp. WL0002]
MSQFDTNMDEDEYRTFVTRLRDASPKRRDRDETPIDVAHFARLHQTAQEYSERSRTYRPALRGDAHAYQQQIKMLLPTLKSPEDTRFERALRSQMKEWEELSRLCDRFIRAYRVEMGTPIPDDMDPVIEARGRDRTPRKPKLPDTLYTVDGPRAVYMGTREGLSFRKATKDTINLQTHCGICRNPINPGDETDIDHKDSWAAFQDKPPGVPLTVICYQGWHFHAFMKDEMTVAYNYIPNLQRAHKDCNTRKNGEKGLYHQSIHSIGRCPGEECDAIKVRKG